MNDRQHAITDMLKLASDIDPDVLNCLLLIKYICTTSNEEPCWNTMLKYHAEKTPWDMIVQELNKTDGDIFSAISNAIEKLTTNMSFSENGLEHLFNAVWDEHL